MLNRPAQPNLKQVYTSSLPDEIQNELHWFIATTKKDLSILTIGQIHQMTLTAIDKLCEQERFIKDLMNKKIKLNKMCQQPYWQIKCKDNAMTVNLKSPAILNQRSFP